MATKRLRSVEALGANDCLRHLYAFTTKIGFCWNGWLILTPLERIFDESPLVADSLSEALEVVLNAARPGVTTREIADLCEREIVERSLTPVMKGLNDFPAAACVSINREVLHGIPSERKIKRGDLVTVQSAARGEIGVDRSLI